jgi:hypothetical protein
MRKIRLRGKGLFHNKVLRALGNDSDLEFPFSYQEEKSSGVFPFDSHYDHKEFMNAMLEAERLKAKAEWEHRRRNLIY